MAFASDPKLLLLLLFLLLLPPSPAANTLPATAAKPPDCTQFFRHIRRHCPHLNSPCLPRSYINYLRLFYCTLAGYPLVGYTLLALWLAALFYLLGDTASLYFCPSLERISALLRLPPTVAGVTLLSLGNGAPDAFSTIASFAGGGGSSAGGVGEIGLSSVLGGAFFVTSAVVGVISLSVSGRRVAVDRLSFFREIGFFVVVLGFLLAILIVGKINFPAAVAFASLYILYVLIVAVSYCWRRNRKQGGELDAPLLPEGVDVEAPVAAAAASKEVKKPSRCIWKLLQLLELPLYLPRRLTIPDVSDARWSKPFAVASAVFSPLLLATLWVSKRDVFRSDESLPLYLFGGLLGLILGVIALGTTDLATPPKKFLLPWLAAEFLMSVVWFYIIAGELVALLVSIGHILGIGPSVLAATVLAWGNSVGDLIANVAMAINGGDDGAQIAISGCYAVPIFNTLVGLGASLVFTSRAAPYVIPSDSTLLVTLGFLVAGLLWALVMLPRRGMKLDRVFGAGLLALYACFLCLRVCDSVGLLEIDALLPL